MNPDVQALLARQSPAVAETAWRAVGLILDLYPDAVVTVDGGDIGFGSSTGYKGLVFVLSPHTSWVTLGVARGATLPDPEGLLQGKGKVHRHVKLHSAADIDRPALRAVMNEAVERRQ
ncbi:DUF1801 domain-containing protein [Streptomyces sp. TRM66268-LWL]|uniref:DUF1801 domain-containing protein n=1 Tax=Streptomyces polyasparticus TaxID=2767826 RepID=A0ABR7SB34_9ACTN|nr:DUF1801 domain-containing protein [Streptomyces polyasparticus]MBC9711970.1 DUF1801 domain-containing protein [Streptomyces polyasparticus]